jgi:hypothetical protein
MRKRIADSEQSYENRIFATRMLGQNSLVVDLADCYIGFSFVPLKSGRVLKKSNTRPFEAGCRRLEVVTHQPMADGSWVRVRPSTEIAQFGIGIG